MKKCKNKVADLVNEFETIHCVEEKHFSEWRPKDMIRYEQVFSFLDCFFVMITTAGFVL